MSNKRTDTATVKATYSTAATFMQSPSPARMEKFDRWLNEIKAQAWDEGWDDADEVVSQGGWIRRNPYRKGN